MLEVVGDSPELTALYQVVDRVADTNCTVLITGESGTGKELVARAVHRTSTRKNGPFVAINCGAIPENLLESELFGHTKGAFAGAVSDKLGRLDLAQGGTLYLDEVADLPLSLQIKLLRVLQTHDYTPVGDNRTLLANVRVVAATNRDLDQDVRDGRFRQDLFYRLNVIHLDVPPLRQRPADLPALVRHFLETGYARTGRAIRAVSAEAFELLSRYSWPGNVRELENTIERSMLLSSGGVIEAQDLPATVRGLPAEGSARPKLPETGIDLRAAVENFENELIVQALERTKWNKNQAAMLLKLNRTTLVEMLKRKRIGPHAA
jgi:transcriptional regulator with GAF, ATPase, and Fis domain